MEMVRHQRPGNAAVSPTRKVEVGPPEKITPILVIEENFSFFVPPAVDMMDGTGEIDSWPSWHGGLIIKKRAKLIGNERAKTPRNR
jgi:hypothetical protein